MHVWVKPKLYTHRECGPSFHPLLHTSYMISCLSAPLSEDASQGILSSKKANNDPGLCPIKGQNSSFCTRIWSQNQFLSLSLSVTKISPPCPKLVIHPAFYLSSYILPRDPHERLRSNKLLNRNVSCEFFGDSISSYSSMSRDPIQLHSVLGGTGVLPIALHYDVENVFLKYFKEKSGVYK